ncbi:hypothetical protein SDC9_198280 [bioreactor metagenome]|uniref:Uncharacterized protein n=1 Tax=bioreactor metagenome TaxID=1076179 RepID=A0A645IH75_9ZZZZ
MEKMGKLKEGRKRVYAGFKKQLDKREESKNEKESFGNGIVFCNVNILNPCGVQFKRRR